MNIQFDLNTIWFILVGGLFTGYALLDGFDLGMGALHLFTKTDTERRSLLNAIGPVWDGNEVWLVIAGGALFATFPKVYAAVFSGFYLAFFVFLFCLIFRAVAIEFRSQLNHRWWRQLWDVSFSVSSIIASLILGVALGNIIRGIPINADGEYVGTFWQLLHPYSILMGFMTLSFFAMHGALFGIKKTEGELHDKLRTWAQRAMIAFFICYLGTLSFTLIGISHVLNTFKQHPILFVLLLLNLVFILNILRETRRGKPSLAFLSSGLALVLLLAIFGIGIYPNLVFSTIDPDFSLNLYNAASSPKTLSVALILALIGIPLVVFYTVVIYRIFRGKVKLDKNSY